MFKVQEGYPLKQQVETAEKSYVIQKNDALAVEVYTNQGERIIDPNMESFKDGPASSTSTKDPTTYTVNPDGRVKFPMIREIKVEGLTLRQAEDTLEKEFARFYEQPFVTLKYTNKRVIVLGAPGGQVIPLVNENVRLAEVLALAKGVNNDAKAHNIRVLRNDQVFVADLSTFEGYLKNNMLVQPGDIVYVEPIRRPFSEGLRDYGVLVSILVSVATLIAITVGGN